MSLEARFIVPGKSFPATVVEAGQKFLQSRGATSIGSAAVPDGDGNHELEFTAQYEGENPEALPGDLGKAIGYDPVS